MASLIKELLNKPPPNRSQSTETVRSQFFSIPAQIPIDRLRAIIYRKHRGKQSRAKYNAKRLRTRRWGPRDFEWADMWQTAYRDQENAETVALHDYPAFKIVRAEVLTQGLRWQRPNLTKEENKNG